MIKGLMCFLTSHKWRPSRLILCVGKYTHHDIRSCNRCGKSEATFSGTRKEWYSHHGF